MVIGRDGSVAFVKLHTPLNRHHERMIVSPAKAWRYRPATRSGKPVMYRILVKVNLPESGTDFLTRLWVLLRLCDRRDDSG